MAKVPKARIDGYALYQAHVYIHAGQLVEGCDFCYPPPDSSEPWDVVNSVTLEGKHKRRPRPVAATEAGGGPAPRAAPAQPCGPSGVRQRT